MERGKRRKLVMVGAAALACTVVVAAALLAVNKAVPVEAAAVEEREVRRTVATTGYFNAVEEKELYARYPIVVSRVLVKTGEQVKAGQVLAQGDETELQVERQSMLAELAVLKAEIGQAGDTLPLELAQAESGVRAARQAFEQAGREAAAMIELYAAGAVPEMEYRRAQASLVAAEADLRRAEAYLAQCEARSLALRASRERVQALQASLELVEKKQAALAVRAPEDGRVAEVLVQEGMAVAAGMPLFLLQMPELLVRCEVLAQDAPALAPGQKVLLSGEALGGRKLSGILAKIHPRAVEKLSELGVKQQRVPVEITLSEQVAGVQPGYPVEVEIITDEKKAKAVPREAVFTLDGKNYVFVIRDGRAALTAVALGLEGDDYFEILSGLELGDVLIVNPPKEVGDKTRVKVKELIGLLPPGAAGLIVSLT